MSPVFKWMLVCASFFFAGAFLWMAFYLGQVFPKGPAPFYIIGAICGAAGLYFLSVRPIPFEGGIQPNAAMPSRRMDAAHSVASFVHPPEEELDDVSVYDTDLTRISPAGCALCLSTVVVVFVVSGVVAVAAPEFLENNGKQKVIGGVMFVVIAAYFLAGRFILKHLGFPFLRKRR